jgi:mRNA interferase RelE/StbE
MAALYGFAYAERALHVLETITPPKLRAQMKRRIGLLASNPTPPGSKKLHSITDGEYPIYRVRQGDYRILYSVRNNPSQIVVLDIGHRKDIYK